MILKLGDLVREWREAAQFETAFLVGIDGRSGAGKSTFVKWLQAVEPTLQRIPLDDFYRETSPVHSTTDQHEVGFQIDWRRLYQQVIEPLIRGVNARYQRFDWNTKALMEWHHVSPNNIVLIDGVYSTRNEISSSLNRCIWITAPRLIGQARAIERDGQASRNWHTLHWEPDQERYFAEHKPWLYADITIEGTDGLRHYKRGEYVRLS